jgi:hypothetical protein
MIAESRNTQAARDRRKRARDHTENFWRMTSHNRLMHLVEHQDCPAIRDMDSGPRRS